MRILLETDYDELSRVGADIIAAAIAAKPDAALLLATGNTPVGLYRELAARKNRGELNTSELRIFQLDSYVGLSIDDPRSLYRWLDREFLKPLGIKPDKVVRLPGDSVSPAAACAAYDDGVASVGGIDLSVLGLGPNGHLGFNEPPSGADSPTRVVTLTAASIESNGRYWGGNDQVPHEALTAGMTTLLAAKRTLLLVSGAHKRDILNRALFGPVTADVPASLLRTARDLTIIADRDAMPSEALSST
jgi:glucosamine-6-phosphate deaminase